MSELAFWPSGTAYAAEFQVKDSTGAAVTGLLDAAFTKKLSKDQANSAVAVTITEEDAANLPGRYKATYTPNAAGRWSLLVTHATYNAWGWQDDIQALAVTNVGDAPNVTGSVGSVAGAVGSVTGNVGGNVVGTVASVVGNVAGDVAGKILGGGSSTITGPGVVDLGVTLSSVNDAAATSTGFVTALTNATSGTYQDFVLVFTTGALAGNAAQIKTYTGSTKAVTLNTGLNAAPANGDKFVLIPCPSPWNQATANYVGGGTFGKLLGGLFISAAGNIKADVEEWRASVPNALVTGRVDASVGAVASGAIAAASFASGALGAVWDELTASHVVANTFGKLVGTNLDATVSSRLATAGYTAPPTVAAIAAAILATPANLLATDASGRVTLGSVAAGAITSAAFAANALGAVWDELTASHVTASTFGKLLGSIALSAAGNVKADLEEWKATAPNALVSGRVDASVGAVASGAIAAAAFASGALGAVWDEPDSSHATAGTTGKLLAFLDAAVSSRLATSGYTAPPTVAQVAAAILATPANLLATDASGRVTVGSLAANAIDSATLTAAALSSIAQQVLKEPLSGVEVALRGAGTPVKALGSAIQSIRNKVLRTSPTVVSVYETDGVTVAWTETLTTDANQDPIVGAAPS